MASAPCPQGGTGEKWYGNPLFRYGDADITKPMSDKDSEIVRELFNGKNLYSDSPSCGFSENVALIIDGVPYCIACDNCGKIFYRIQAHIDRQKRRGQNSFCCLKCQKEYLHKQLFEIRACEICGREFEVSKTSKQRFCSDACQIQWQTMQVGELNPRFTSILTPCTYCGKEHYVKPYKFNQQDNFFCSTECRQAWYAEVYSQRDEWKEISRQRILTQFQNGNLDTETTPQKIVNSMLDEIGIRYDREKQFEYYAVDNYLDDYDLIMSILEKYSKTDYENILDFVNIPLKFVNFKEMFLFIKFSSRNLFIVTNFTALNIYMVAISYILTDRPVYR